MRKIHEIPFDSETKMMTVITRSPSGQETAYIKGAADILLNKCAFVMTSNGEVPIDRSVTDKINAEISSLSKRALRVLALAKKEVKAEKVIQADWYFWDLPQCRILREKKQRLL